MIDASRRLLDPVVFHGRQGFRDFVSMLDEAWGSQRVEPAEFIEVGEALVVPVRLVSVGRNSGVKVRARSAWVARFRGDRVSSWTAYQSKDDALASVRGGE